MELIIVRHAQTDANKNGIVQGHSESHLTPLGKKQAKKIAERLKEHHIDYAYSSDLTRAIETAEEILKYHHIPLEKTKELREKHAGIFEGKSNKPRLLSKEQIFNRFHGIKPFGGESFLGAQKRIINFYNKLVEKHKGKTVLIVAHGAVLGALLLHLLDKPITWEEYDKHRPQNAAITIVKIEDTKKHTVHLLNCTKHLHGIESHNLAEE
ncbi:histidine phosphatase family protein [Candidatus Woesearchaeota archaeon]|nr:histidine phosphatase family protein [Candidatus Woesearchaeota archaeon]